ncbi:MAG: DNA polymerase III subunit epsilon [Pararhodobacter sp.]|nr:DNA polymerase III subunit epsilon [Pararhodobacter sp.]
MRQIVLDTETTGLEPTQGHRIVEIGAVEIQNYVVTGRVYHQYINPLRDMPTEAEQVHGLSEAFLKDYPPFDQIAPAFLDFIADSPLVIHNASFDMRFINAELERLRRPPLPSERAIDTLHIARRKFPGASVSLDALCRRFSIDNSAREKHGALLDSELLAEVYLELIGGRQPGFALTAGAVSVQSSLSTAWKPTRRPQPLPSLITPQEAEAHQSFVDELGDGALWKKRVP